jgi:hypothetical protein
VRTHRIASFIHKWLGVLMAIQILFWFVSGLFFAVFRSSGPFGAL